MFYTQLLLAVGSVSAAEAELSTINDFAALAFPLAHALRLLISAVTLQPGPAPREPLHHLRRRIIS